MHDSNLRLFCDPLTLSHTEGSRCPRPALPYKTPKAFGGVCFALLALSVHGTHREIFLKPASYLSTSTLTKPE
jgi:hypothetical protein